MKKLNETYLHESTGITFDIQYDGEKKKVRIINGSNLVISGNKETAFIFNRSKPETIIKVANALLEIGNFVETL
jgi:hypothetical protein